MNAVLILNRTRTFPLGSYIIIIHLFRIDGTYSRYILSKTNIPRSTLRWVIERYLHILDIDPIPI